MPHPHKLSELVNAIEGAIRNHFDGKAFWVTAEITDVKIEASWKKALAAEFQKEYFAKIKTFLKSLLIRQL